MIETKKDEKRTKDMKKKQEREKQYKRDEEKMKDAQRDERKSERQKRTKKKKKKYIFFVHLFRPFVLQLINYETNLFLIIYPKVLAIIFQTCHYFTFFIW